MAKEKKEIVKTIEKRDDLRDGDLVEFNDVLFKVERRCGVLTCLSECDMKGFPGRPYCTGFCFRFSNGGRYVFKRTDKPTEDYTVVEIRKGIKDKI